MEVSLRYAGSFLALLRFASFVFSGGGSAAGALAPTRQRGVLARWGVLHTRFRASTGSHRGVLQSSPLRQSSPCGLALPQRGPCVATRSSVWRGHGLSLSLFQAGSVTRLELWSRAHGVGASPLPGMEQEPTTDGVLLDRIHSRWYGSVTMKIIDIPQSGSVGAVTSSRNRSGQYRRARAIPTQPRTVSQMAARARLSALAAGWRGLTSAQIAAWNAFGQSFTVTNSLGTTINLTGLQCYIKVNTVNLLNGVSVVNNPPALPAFVANLVTGITVNATTPAFTLDGAAPAAGTLYMVYCSPALSPGITFNGRYSWIVSTPTFTTGHAPILTPYTAKFGALVVGKQYFVKVVQDQAGMQDNGTVFRAIAT